MLSSLLINLSGYLMRTERALQAYFIKECKKIGWLARKTETPGHRGWPDVTVIKPGGEVWFIEFKSPTGRGVLSPHQIKTLADLGVLGANVLVLESKEEVDRFISCTV